MKAIAKRLNRPSSWPKDYQVMDVLLTRPPMKACIRDPSDQAFLASKQTFSRQVLKKDINPRPSCYEL